MSKVVFKFVVPIQAKVKVLMPKDAQILRAGLENDECCIWALVDEYETEYEKRYFRVFGTGVSFQTDVWMSYVGTVSQHGVHHLFEGDSDE